MTESALEIDGLSYGYGRGFAIEDISFRIGKGEFTALLGPNGAGKTTLFSLITRLFEAPRGKIRVCGINLRERPTKALAHMGVVFQQPTLDLDLTVRQNLHYFASLHGIGRRDAADRIDEALEGIEEKIASGAIKEYAPAKTTPEDLFKLFEPVPLAAE